MKQNKHRNLAERAAAVVAWSRSGEAADAWANRAGISVSSFARWRAEAEAAAASVRGERSPVAFMRLPATSERTAWPDIATPHAPAGLSREWTLEAGDVRVRLSRGTAWDDVARLLAAVRSTP